MTAKNYQWFHISELKDRLNKWYHNPLDLFGGIILPSIFINLLGLVFPLILLQIYNRVIPHAAYSTLLLLIIGVIIALILEVALRILRAIVTGWIDARSEYLLSVKVFNDLLATDLTSYETKGAGNYIEYLNSIHKMKDSYGGKSLTVLIDTPFITIYLILIAYLGGTVVIVPILIVSLLISIHFVLNKKMNKFTKEKQKLDHDRFNFIIELLKGIQTIKANAMEMFLLRRYERIQDKLSENRHQISHIHYMTQFFSVFCGQLTIALVTAIGAYFVIQGNMSIGGLAACILLSSRVLQPIGHNVLAWQQHQNVKISEELIMNIDKLKKESILENSQYIIHGRIEIHNLIFSYPNNKIPILNKINLLIKPGETIAITGASMNERTTLLWLILGILKPSTGFIKIDEYNLANTSLTEIRKNIAYIPQKGVLFNGTILENITMYRNDLIEKAYLISDKLGLSTILSKYPNGFYTEIGGQAGETVSPGIQQLISIARALLEDRKIILFDEAFSFLDPSIIQLINKFLVSLKLKHTMVFASNRKDILKMADRIFEFKNGYIKEKQYDRIT